MRGNVEAAMKLGPHLEHLQDKTDDLAKSAQDFRRGASHVRKEIWWKKMKTYICISVGVIILCIVIIVPAGKFYSTFSLIPRR
jgi:vesicle-associated membrane protein 4